MASKWPGFGPPSTVVIGEFQHVAARHADGELRLTAIGEVLLGRAPGRTSTEEITMFDGSGIALQGLCMAQKLVDLLRPGAAFS